MAHRIRVGIILAVTLGIACGGDSSPTTPATITSVAITGLPQPLLFDIPSSLKAGRSYTVGATATFDDGSSAVVQAARWTTTDPAIASFDRNVLRAHREGRVSIRVALENAGLTASREVTVRSSATIVREERAERIEPCGNRVCPYPYCPRSGPYWLFPVHEDGTVELVNVSNPGWGSPSNYVTQLSASGEPIKSWLLLRVPPFNTASVPGGFMYVFTMTANSDVCGDVAAAWTHPN